MSDDKRYEHQQNRRDEINRTVPPEENYYADGQNFDFNRRTRRNDDVVFNEEGFNPTEIDYRNNNQNTNYNNQNRNYNSQNRNHNNQSNHRNNQSNRSNRHSSGGGAKARTAKRKKKNNKLLQAFIIILSIILVFVIATASLVTPVLGKINYDDKKENKYVNATDLYSEKSVTNILLLGVDARANEEGDESRSDSMMLVSIDKKHHCIKMTSFLRDSWVHIPVKNKMQRLNAACQYDGYQGVVDTIEYNFGVKIDGYVVTDFEMFKVMVDSIGGVEVDVTKKEAREVTKHPKRYGHVTLEEGKHKLTGKQALAYCRIRKIDTDWKRTERQRTVMEQILKGLLGSGPVTMYKTAKNVAPYIETNLSQSQLVKAGVSALTCISGGFVQASCPFEGTWKYEKKGGASVITLNAEQNKKELIDFIYNKSKSDLETKENNKNK